MRRSEGRKPSWLKVRLPQGNDYSRVKGVLKAFNLATVCEEARCPNVAHCWEGGTATVMILGEICTRACRFCAVATGNPRGKIDWSEPRRIGAAAKALGWKYVVLTSVDRDDLPDGGAGIFAETIRAIREFSPETLVEALIPDFQGILQPLEMVVEACPRVVAHNIETVRRLTPLVRDRRAGYDQSMEVLRRVKEIQAGLYTKSSLMVGLGETEDEIIETMADLRDAGVDILTIGQYLRPTNEKRHLPVIEYLEPEKFKKYRKLGLEMGFVCVASGPLVRSSYRAYEFFLEALHKRTLIGDC